MAFRQVGDDIGLRKIPALSRPTLAQLQKEYRELGILRIEQDASPIVAVRLGLATVLEERERGINGDEYMRRLALALEQGSVFGYQQLIWLVGHPANLVLWDRTYVDGPALVVVCPDGKRIPCVRTQGGCLRLSWRLLAFGLHRNGRVAIVGA